MRYLELTWLGRNSDPRCNLVSKRPSHRQPWDVVILEPHSEWTDWVFVWIPEGVDPSTVLDYSGSLVSLAWLLVPRYSLRNQLTRNIPLLLLDDYASRIANIRAEKFLA